MKSEIIFESDNHKWIYLGRDTDKPDDIIDTNQYLILSENNGLLLDPGGSEIFPQVLAEITRFIEVKNLKAMLSSHQDPDIASSMAMWLELCPNMEIYAGWIWEGFLKHFGMGTKIELHNIPDEGMELTIGDSKNKVYFVPAHFCHSSGNYSCYDPKANILFSGDIGAALLPPGHTDIYVRDFDSHIQYIEFFHKRWMPSEKALKAWVNRARLLNPDMIAPQHGSIYRGEAVGKFLNWLESIEVAKLDLGEEETNISNAVWLKHKFA